MDELENAFKIFVGKLERERQHGSNGWTILKLARNVA
jgi:hypothetical protein